MQFFFLEEGIDQIIGRWPSLRNPGSDFDIIDMCELAIRIGRSSLSISFLNFLTLQVDEKDTQLHSNAPVDEQRERKKEKKEIHKLAEDEKKKYKGYEELIDTDDEVLEGEELPKAQG